MFIKQRLGFNYDSICKKQTTDQSVCSGYSPAVSAYRFHSVPRFKTRAPAMSQPLTLAQHFWPLLAQRLDAYKVSGTMMMLTVVLTFPSALL